ALESVLNAESPVRTVGFFGVEGEHLYCCTNCETLSLWHPQDAQRIADYGDIRSLASPGVGSGAGARAGAGAGAEAAMGWGGGGSEAGSGGARAGWGVTVDYAVGCHYEQAQDQLWLVAGGFDGRGVLARVFREGLTPEALLGGGHREQIRAFDWRGESGGGGAGLSVVTGGEDAKVCSWGVPSG
ncbi:unnamed protein product, partial [Discosporangium mesarthrocarpum]